MRVTISIDLSTCPFIPLPHSINSRRVPPLLNPSLVLFPQQSVWVSHGVCLKKTKLIRISGYVRNLISFVFRIREEKKRVARRKRNWSGYIYFVPKCSRLQTGKWLGQLYPCRADDNGESFCWPQFLKYPLDEEFQWRTHCVWVLRLYTEWNTRRGHESLWRPSWAYEEESYHLLHVDKSRNPLPRCHRVHYQSEGWLCVF